MINDEASEKKTVELANARIPQESPKGLFGINQNSMKPDKNSPANIFVRQSVVTVLETSTQTVLQDLNSSDFKTLLEKKKG